MKSKSLNIQRREALKKIKNLSLAGIAGSVSYLWNYRNSSSLQESNVSLQEISTTSLQYIESKNIKSQTLDLLTYPFISNITNKILSLPLKYFSIPNEFSYVLESNPKRHSNTTLIIPLVISKDFNHTQKALYHAYNVENINKYKIYNKTSSFLSYHYDTLKSLAADLESKGFIITDLLDLMKDSKELSQQITEKILKLLVINEKRGAKDINDVELDIDKQIPDYTWFNHKDISSNGDIIDKEPNISIDNILKYQVPKSDDKNSLYQQFNALEDKRDKLAIDTYNEALKILNDYKDYYFTHTRKFNNKGVMLNYKDDKNKARRLLECLHTIGQNNIKALYVGTSNQSKDKKRPKLIGRLATTIIMEDGLC
ncbi:hypothetical protein DCO58_08210 [Helicobacter saguini]|uniref:Uncharacterized protein n=1 Tax=Helicobacter saguini TaxID=1548018 RepID=A0A347W4V8_9HELI|nr:hypothetical protein [Helicobacter saguini]MWV61693.1 hypothetical protein [Helicobacter saguini]MWV67635.1 hypothetical protein [Helicobacter saguini]MWV69986.1 hypothetical protein [Helicobacter saguini]MWV72800.1 hypothetical protein [Helicobacter saguini]TLD91989.1 hypothetical protein LS64_011050 [Helicobacter saguini]